MNMRQNEVNERADNAALELARMIMHKAEAFERKPEDIPLDENNMIKYSEDLGFDEAGVCCLMYWSQTELLTRINFKGEDLVVRVVALSSLWDAEGNPHIPVIPDIPIILMVGIPRDERELDIYNMDYPVGIEYLRQLEECMSIVKEYKKESPIPTSFKTIDRVLGGIRPSQLVLLASRPGVGKSSFAMTMARNIAVDKDIPTAYFSLEMSSSQLSKRLLCQESSLTLRQAGGVEQCNGEEVDRVTEALSKSPLYIDDTPALELDDFRAKAEKLVKENGVKVIIIDYMQLMNAPQAVKNQSRKEELRHIVKILKQTAMELNVAIIGLSMLVRNTFLKPSPEPTLEQLYEQGLDFDFLKDNVDMVWMLNRPEMYGFLKDNSKAELIVAHNAHGDRDLVIDLKFETDYARFTDSPDKM